MNIGKLHNSLWVTSIIILRFELSMLIIEVAYMELWNASLGAYPNGIAWRGWRRVAVEGEEAPSGRVFMGLPPCRDLLPRSGGGPRGEACPLARKLDGSRGGYLELFREYPRGRKGRHHPLPLPREEPHGPSSGPSFRLSMGLHPLHMVRRDAGHGVEA